MRAVVLRKTGEPEQLVSDELPDPILQPEDVLVRIRAAAVCGRDLIDRRGGFPLMKLPTVLGHEFAGEVVALGALAAASGLNVGDRVINLHRPSCGACRRCVNGELILCERAWQSFGHTVDGGYAELCAAHHRALVKVPASVPFEVASTLMCTAGVALYALRSRGRLTLGETALITGASGGIGHIAVQLAKRIGARVLAVASGTDGVALVEELGADVAVDGHSDDVAEAARAFAPEGLDAALVLAGGKEASLALEAVKHKGRIAYPNGVEPVPDTPEGTVAIAYDGTPGAEALDRLNRLIGVEPFHVELAQLYLLEDAAKAHLELDKHHLGKLAFKVGPTSP